MRFKASAQMRHRICEKASLHFTTTSRAFLEHRRWVGGGAMAVAENTGFQCSSTHTCDSQVNGVLMKDNGWRQPNVSFDQEIFEIISEQAIL